VILTPPEQPGFAPGRALSCRLFRRQHGCPDWTPSPRQSRAVARSEAKEDVRDRPAGPNYRYELAHRGSTWLIRASSVTCRWRWGTGGGVTRLRGSGLTRESRQANGGCRPVGRHWSVNEPTSAISHASEILPSSRWQMTA